MEKRFIKNLVEYGLFWGTTSIVRAVPRPAALAIGRGLGKLSQLVLRKRTHTALENLRKAFPEMPEQQVQKNVREMFKHIGMSGVEMLRMDMFEEKDLSNLFDFQGMEHLQEAHNLNKGVLLLTGHVGFWEVGTFFLSHLGFPTDYIAKRMKNPYVDRYITRMRESTGGHCLESKKGARKIVRALNQKRIVAVLLDQHITPREAVCVNFFNRPAFTSPIIAQMAMKYGIPVVPVFCHRTKDNCYKVVAEPMILLEKSDAPQDIVKNTERLSSYIEKAVRKEIPQWFWLHRRWRDHLVPKDSQKPTP